MVRKPAKQGGGAASASASAKKAPVVDPPPPFSRAPELEPFLSTLDTDKVYITHIDTHAAAWKKRIFLIPVALNTAICALLAWRTYAAFPTYWALFLAALGNKTEYSVERDAATWGELANIAVRRAGLFLLDYVLFVFVGSWPATFFGLVEGENAGEDSMVFRQKVLPAIDRRYVREKTGSLMVDQNWDLDFDAMIKAHELVDKSEIEEIRFEKSVWIFPGEEVGWCVWEVHKLDGEGAEAEGRKKIMAFKDRLTAIGKENLFFRWIELIQYESSQPGGFTPERQQDAVVKAKELFERQGVDFEQFIKDIGGLDGIPGLENSGR